MIGTKVLKELEGEAKERMSEGGKGTEKIPDLGESREKAAKLTNTNSRYVSDAKKLQDERPDLAFDDKKSGTATLPEPIEGTGRHREGSPKNWGR